MGGGALQLSVQVPSGQEYIFEDIVHVSTGIFDLIDIVDSDGWRYTNAIQSSGLKNTLLKDGADDFHGINPFNTPIVIGGGKTLYFEVLDTSTSSNTINFALSGTRITK